MYDIVKDCDYPKKRKQWGRLYYHPDAAGIQTPVMFQPYFNWSKRPFNRVPKWNKDSSGKIIGRAKTKCGKNATRLRFNWCEECLTGLRQIWEDRDRIVKRRWYCETY